MSMRSRGGGGFGGGAGGGRFGGGGGGRKYGVVKAKREGGTGAGWVGGEGGGLEEDVSSDDGGVGGMRFSIEHINIVSDEEDGWGGGGEEEEEVKVKGKGKAKAKAAVGAGVNRGLRPIRVERQEHQERAVGVNTEASSGKSAELRKQAKAKAREKEGGEESLFVQDSEEGSEEEEDEPEVTAEKAVGRRRAGGTDAAADGEVRIKEEPTDDGDVLMTDAIPQATDDATTTADAGATKPKTKKTRASKKDKDPRSKLQTEEERQEWDRYEEDTEHIRHTLGTLATTQDKPPAAEGGEGQADKEEESKESVEEAPKDERSGRLFLIQFPPSTPNLVVPSLAADEEMNQDVIEADAHTQQQQQQQQPAIKQEAGSAVPVPSQPTPALAGKGSRNNISAPPLITAATNATLPPGRAGKLNIHRSGRATINWGGISFELTKGSDVEFLQDAIVASEGGKREEDESGMAVDERRVWAMSQVSGKFVVTPDWGELLG
ncbi:hypothetical protein AJ79_07740 [Helicocarpus griseus UAMH5409]|uniref:DNA-directed RNA polymerase III RPC4 n=1 Tax=Helicocarpus griseus UAMH5409 TaxID=1447875 RepID=A0A2B7WZL1_9EURO|nr:hypothetical protein AJ79_07740 [Helicocarpus griseus UAMH5409]